MLPNSQLAPVNPFGQRQTNAFPGGEEQSAEFKHGLRSQESSLHSSANDNES